METKLYCIDQSMCKKCTHEDDDCEIDKIHLLPKTGSYKSNDKIIFTVECNLFHEVVGIE